MKTIEQQTGWSRPHPAAICQDLDALRGVSEFSYDLNRTGFVDYFQRRTGIMITQCECGWDRVCAVLANPTVPTDDPSWIITRAKLQDCWEIYTNEKD